MSTLTALNRQHKPEFGSDSVYDKIIRTTGQSLPWVDDLGYIGVFTVHSEKFK